MMIMTTLRRPNEIIHLRVRDINFDTNPTTIMIPANLSKKSGGTTFTTIETSDLILDHIKRNKLGIDDYIFGKIPMSKTPVEQMDYLFRYHMCKYSDLNLRAEGTNRHDIYIYSFKKFSYTRE